MALPRDVLFATTSYPVLCTRAALRGVGRGGGVLTRDDGFSGERGGVLVFSRVEICHPGPALGIAGGLVGRASAVRKLRRGGLALAD